MFFTFVSNLNFVYVCVEAHNLVAAQGIALSKGIDVLDKSKWITRSNDGHGFFEPRVGVDNITIPAFCQLRAASGWIIEVYYLNGQHETYDLLKS